jgi:hypothetical protein
VPSQNVFAGARGRDLKGLQGFTFWGVFKDISVVEIYVFRELPQSHSETASILTMPAL